ncbi:MAG: glycosyltransferase family 39 protein, partial [Verrucomicrobiae bacterium]|nr:glycosyltransferase family 39 protein [Verrucomicrobiae bacterium]
MASLILNLDSRKRIWLVLINLFLVLLLSLLVLPSTWLPGLIRYTTIPVLALAVGLFFFVLLNQLRRLPRPAYERRFNTGILILILTAAGFQFVHEDFGYKILMDEYNLTATSLNIHENKTAFTPTRGVLVQGDFEVVDGYIDKRPFLFPFLVSILHDLTGYRMENSHILNVLLTFTLFLVIYLAGFHLGGKRGGVLAVSLLAGFPLIGQNATGAGFELLNFVLLSLTAWLCLSLVARPGLEKETLLVLSAILLAQVRYESVIFLVPVILVIAFRWKATPTIGPGWITAFSPWLLMPLLLQNRWFRSRAGLWELPGEITNPFSLSYIPDNLGHAVMYFFNYSAEFQNSLLLTVVGFLSLFFLIVVSLKRYRNWVSFKPRDYDVLGLWGLALVGHTLLILAYHAGKLDSHF